LKQDDRVVGKREWKIFTVDREETSQCEETKEIKERRNAEKGGLVGNQ
jgi:hypothetical protein